MGKIVTESRALPNKAGNASARRANGNVIDATRHSDLDGLQYIQGYRSGLEEVEELFQNKLFNVDPVRNFTEFSFKRGNNFDNGHELVTWKKHTELSQLYKYIPGRNNVYYKGPIVPHAAILNAYGRYQDPAPAPSASVGARAIAITSPLNSIANVSQTLAEIKREGMPSIPGSQLFSINGLRDRTSVLRALGGEYLNIKFGWDPLVRDLINVLKAVTESERLLNQLSRDSGQNIRRRYTFPETLETTISDIPMSGFVVTLNLSTADESRLWPDNGTGIAVKSGSLSMSTSKKVKTWFSSAYTYYLEEENDLFSKIRLYAKKARYLLGLKLTPEVLWELTPWSWLIDWVANFGDLFHNISQFTDEGLVLRYGYLMEETSFERTYTLSGARFNGDSSGGVYSTSFHTVTKRRVQATPYGFGLDWSSFSDGQWAILAALGMSKAPRTPNLR